MPADDASQPTGAPGAAFEAFLKGGEFRLQCCRACGRQIYYPRTVCHYCGSGDLQWLPASGRGFVYSTTTVRQKPDRGGDYNVAIIQLVEGARLLSRIVDVSPSDVRIDMPVVAIIREAGGVPQLLFRPSAGA